MKRLFLLALFVVPAFLPLESFVVQPETNHIEADTLCFARDILPIFNSNCAMSGCHDASSQRSGYNLTTYTGVMRGIKAGSTSTSTLYRQIQSGSMPQYPWLKVPDSLKTRLATWITSGAKNTTCTDGTCDTSNVTYLKDIKPIIQVNCVGCHQTSQAEGGMFLDDDAANNQQKLTIYNAVLSTMPKNIAHLTPCQIAKIRVWANKIDAVSNDPSSDDSFRVVQNNGVDLLHFQLQNASSASISVYSADGRMVMSVPNGSYNSGFNEVRLNSTDYGHGLFFVRFVSSGTVRSLKFIR